MPIEPKIHLLSKNIPTQPNGELLNSCARLIGFVRSKAGVGLTDNKIGAKEIDTSIEIIMNKLYHLVSNCQHTLCRNNSDHLHYHI